MGLEFRMKPHNVMCALNKQYLMILLKEFLFYNKVAKSIEVGENCGCSVIIYQTVTQQISWNLTQVEYLFVLMRLIFKRILLEFYIVGISRDIVKVFGKWKSHGFYFLIKVFRRVWEEDVGILPTHTSDLSSSSRCIVFWW